MLQNIGDKLKGQGEGGGRAHRWVWYSILGALGLVFAAWGPYSVVDMSFGQGDYAAKVDGEKISADEMNRAWQQQQPRLMQAFGGQLSPEQRTQFQQQLIDSAVRGLATTTYASRIGYRVSDAQLSRAFQQEEAFQVDGKFNLQAARSRLVAAGITEEGFVRELRQSLLSNQLLGVINASDFLTPAEGKRVLTLLDEERELRFALLQPDAFVAQAPIEAGAIEAYYQAHKDDYLVPESVKLAYAELSLADVAATVQVTDEQLRARYEQDKSKYQREETRRARHILIAVDGETDDAKAKAKATDLYNQLKGGADFAAIAKANSVDTASAARGGDLDWAARDVYVKEFADKLFTMKEGELSEPVKTQFGYHVIRLDGIRAAEGRSFEDVRGELAASLRNEIAVERFGQRQDQLQERLERAGSSIDQLATEFGLRRGEIAQFERGAGGLPLGSDAELNREVFSDTSLTQRRAGGPVQLGEDHIAIFQVLAHSPPAARPLAEVRDGIVEALRREQGAQAALAAAQKAAAELAAGKSFDAVAASLKVRAEPARFVARSSPELPVEIRDAAFAAARPVAGKPFSQALKLEDGTVALFEVTGSRVQGFSDNPQLQQMRSQRELARYTQRDLAAYMSDVQRSAKVRTNPQVFQQ
ncbi:MAG: SurA N-terminal domain-containing protein [Steroidobacteraceae bacterium]